MSLPRIAVTMGDPAGVGPELCLRLLADNAVGEFCRPIVFGEMGVLRRIANRLLWPNPDPKFAHDIAALDGGYDAITPGRVSAECGAAAYRYFTTAIEDALAG